jgi:hypothetical protein
MNNKLENKLITIAKLYKYTNKWLISDGFILPTDYANTWTNGYIADMGGVNFEMMSQEAKMLQLKAKPSSTMRYCIENGPTLKQIIPVIQGSIANDIYTDFTHPDHVCIKSLLEVENNEPTTEAVDCWVNGKYLTYFKTIYPSCEFYLTGVLKPILVKVDGSLIGLIMPIKHS